MDFRRAKCIKHYTLFIDGEEAEKVESFTFLGFHISADLTWFTNISHQVGDSTAKPNSTDPPVRVSSCTGVQCGSDAIKKKNLQWVVRTAEWLIGTTLYPPDFSGLYFSIKLLLYLRHRGEP